MKKLAICLVLWVASAAAQNLTPTQKEADFRYMTSLFATYYAPLEWKKIALSVDAMNIKPWLDKVAATTTDLDFYEVCAQYVQSLNDSHVQFFLPSDFSASLGFGVDIYDGALLIDAISRATLPAARFPFGAGDELISIDGEDALALTDKLAKYVPQGNPQASRREGAARLTSRSQSRFPHAPDLPDSSTVVIKRQSGATETYTIPWVKIGTPMAVGPVPSPKGLSAARSALQNRNPLERLQWSGSFGEAQSVLGAGARNPIFLAGLPATFTRRMGGAAADFYYSGVFQKDDLRIGYIRVPNFSPPSTTTAGNQFQTEINFFNANTDGLIVDVMRNPGGGVCFTEELVRRLTPFPFQAVGYEIRPYWAQVLDYYEFMVGLKNSGLPAETIEQAEAMYNELLAANREGRFLTKPVSACTVTLTRTPFLGTDGVPTAFLKPVMVLIDEFSGSNGDAFPAMLQDSGRAILYGMPTNGAGGSNDAFDTGAYTEAFVGMTIALQSRSKMVSADGFPTSPYIENVGVRPDIQNDYMTRENLTGNGAKFISEFLDAMAAYIKQPR